MTTIARRKGRWTPLGVAAVVLGFMAWWPLGLAVVAYIMWGGSIDELAQKGLDELKGAFKYGTGTRGTTGNAAFDAYREETLRRLEEERAEFDAFVVKLREARDRSEFETFMAERKKELAQGSRTA
jgi:hypothetical protein